MNRKTHLRTLSVFVVASVFVPLLTVIPSSAAAQSIPVATVADNVLYLIQGKTSADPDLSDHDFYALHIISYVLPHNVSRVYSDVPRDARNISIVNLINPAFGWESTGPMAGKFYVDVPASHPRNDSFNHTEIAAEFPSSQFINTTYSSGTLRLVPDKTVGSCVSTDIPVQNAFNITSANMTVLGTNLTNVATELSSNGGQEWVSVSGPAQVQFAGQGTVLKIRFVLRGNPSAGGDPKITGFDLHADYVAVATSLTLHISYVWTPEFIHGIAAINATEPLQYSPNGALFIMLYLVKGYTATGQGMILKLDQSGAMSSYPDKDLYLNLSEFVGQSPSLSIQVIAPPSPAVPWSLYLGSAVVLACIVSVFAYARHQRISRLGVAPAPSSEEDEEETPDVVADAERRAELVARKKMVMSEIEAVREKRASGELGADDADTRLSELKQEYRTIRNDINRIPKGAPAGAIPSTAQVSEEYESVLASLARLDEDFERGRLPDASYKSLREKYLSKATLMKAQVDASASKAGKLEVEKTKLMEAIVALEDERGRGEIDAKVYDELSSSYKKELAEILKRIEEEGG